jgi:hypothetical protein
MRVRVLPRGAGAITVVGARTADNTRWSEGMHAPDTFAESGSPLKPRDGSSAASPAPDSADNTIAGPIRLAVGLCVAEQRDGIETLRRCVRAAREDGIKPERVVLWVHAAWDEYAGHAEANADRDGKRLRLTGIALDAYFAAQ